MSSELHKAAVQRITTVDCSHCGQNSCLRCDFMNGNDAVSDKPEYLSAVCQCGKVRLKATGAPIFTGACYCTSCQQAGHLIEQMLSAPPVLDGDGGTSFVLYRKDRVHCVSGQEHLEERRLKPQSPTRRVVATCCNSAMFLDFTKGHWLSIWRNRISDNAPPLEARLNTKERRPGVKLPDDIPAYRGPPGRFAFRLLTSWAAMGFRRPDVPLGRPSARVQ